MKVTYSVIDRKEIVNHKEVVPKMCFAWFHIWLNELLVKKWSRTKITQKVCYAHGGQ